MNFVIAVCIYIMNFVYLYIRPKLVTRSGFIQEIGIIISYHCYLETIKRPYLSFLHSLLISDILEIAMF